MRFAASLLALASTAACAASPCQPGDTFTWNGVARAEAASGTTCDPIGSASVLAAIEGNRPESVMVQLDWGYRAAAGSNDDSIVVTIPSSQPGTIEVGPNGSSVSFTSGGETTHSCVARTGQVVLTKVGALGERIEGTINITATTRLTDATGPACPDAITGSFSVTREAPLVD